MPIPNQIFYVEFQTKDLEKTKAFFSKTFGWNFTDYGPDYSAFGDHEFGGGLVRADKRSRVDEGGVLPVLFTRELERMRESVVRNGGTVTREIFSFPGGRRFHFTEPSGNELSVCSLEGV